MKKRYSVIFCLLLTALFLFSSCSAPAENAPTQTTATAIEETETVFAEPELIKTVKIGSAGDILIHNPILSAARTAEGNYDFRDNFSLVKNEISACDYFIANLEITLGGEEKGYSSYPCFNTPDTITDAIIDAGIDCVLTANNHCYDTGTDGLLRTLSVLDEKGLAHTGTRQNESDKKYLVVDVSGIKLGLLCYTFETGYEGGKGINGIPVAAGAAPLINSFDYGDLDSFYSDISLQMAGMKKEGADIIIVYPHWGNEYELSPNSYEKEIAQQLCNLGADVIIGGHPHVVQPADLLTSETDASHSTVCLYSMGNFISNQRRNLMDLSDGHTEDGVIFELTLSLYSDGAVTLDSAECVPTWVNMCNNGEKTVYYITPLRDEPDENTQGLSFIYSGVELAAASRNRTLSLVAEGTDKINALLKSCVVTVNR